MLKDKKGKTKRDQMRGEELTITQNSSFLMPSGEKSSFSPCFVERTGQKTNKNQKVDIEEDKKKRGTLRETQKNTTTSQRKEKGTEKKRAARARRPVRQWLFLVKGLLA